MKKKSEEEEKSQSATEYLMVVGFVMIILIPGIYLYVKYSHESQDSITNAKIDSISNEIIEAAEQVYSYGVGSQTTLKVDLPKNIKMIQFQGKEIVFLVVNTRGQESEVAKAANVNLEGQITIVPGLKEITIKSLGDVVSVRVECVQGEIRCGSDWECGYHIPTYVEGGGCLMECNNNKWDLKDNGDCHGTGCSDGICGACIEGQKSCDFLEESCGMGYPSCVTICQDDEWVPYYECYIEMGCANGNCLCSPEQEGFTRCGKPNECEQGFPCVMKCEATEWIEDETCEGDTPTCDIIDGNGQCVPPCLEDEEEDKKCSTLPNQCTAQHPFECKLECITNVWQPYESCGALLQACIDGGAGIDPYCQ